jgi:hypothetical protein
MILVNSWRVGQRLRFAVNQVVGPVEIICAVILRLQGSKQSIVIKPMGLPLTKLLVRGPEVFPFSFSEICPCDFDQPVLRRDHPSVVHSIVPSLLFKIASFEQFVGNEFSGAD